jgi:RNA polymerase sigma-70 factor (ECF subfamily)
MLHDRADAEDAVQEAFTRAYLARARYDSRQPYRGWLFAILVNCCRTVALQRTRRERRFARDESALARAVVAPEPLLDETRSAVVRLVGSLEPLLREAFLLKYVEELDYREMSVALGASPSALKMRVKRACEALRPRLRELYHD